MGSEQGLMSRGMLLSLISPLLIIASLWLGYQMILVPLTERGPPELAGRLAPGSPRVLSRLAEVEYRAGRIDNAESLARLSLQKAPFNVQALRVLGLSEARTGHLDRADQLITLAGNWSLRDDLSHGWLVDRRLRQGDYASAFAHADALARRRPTGPVFALYTTAAVQDGRAIRPLVSILSTAPPWREGYLDSLRRVPAATELRGRLAIALQRTPAPFTDRELAEVYGDWLIDRRIPALKQLRQLLGRPPGSSVADGDFDGEGEVAPFGWALTAAPGMSISRSGTDDGGESALRVEYNGIANGVMAEQLLVLPAGRYRLLGRARRETPGETRMTWEVSCFESGSVISRDTTGGAGSNSDWGPFENAFDVPATACSAQWLRLRSRPGEDRIAIVAWFDDLSVAGMN